MGQKIYNYLIYSASDYAVEVATMAQDIKNVVINGFLDDNKKKGEEIMENANVLGGIKFMDEWDGQNYIVIAIGNIQVKRDIVEKLKKYSVKYTTLIHPSCIVTPTAKIGTGCIIMWNSIISSNASIGDHTIINQLCYIGHSVKVGSFCNINPGAMINGNCVIGDGCVIGSNATIKEKVKIGDNCVVGAGTYIAMDLPDGSITTPAKPTKWSPKI